MKKLFDCSYKILSEIHFTDVSAPLPIHSDLLTVRR